MNAPLMRRSQRGLSIVELMVAVTISLIMFAVIIELFSTNKEAYRLQEGASVLNENARFAVSHLQFYMRHADHWGGIEPDNVTLDGGIPALAVDCAGAPVISSVGFRGFNGGTTLPAALNNCVPAANYQPNTDAFFIRYAASHEHNRLVPDDTVPVPPAGVPILPDDTDAPIQSSYLVSADGGGIWVSTALGRRAMIFQNTDHSSIAADVQFTNDETNSGAGAYYRFQSMLYYIRACSNVAGGTSSTTCDAGDDNVPTLVRLTLNPDLSFTEQDIVTGVENLQMLYGVDTDNDFVADRFDTAATVDANGDWANVVVVRMSLMVANLERDNTVNDTNTYTLQGTNWQPPAAARSFRRKQYDFAIQIRNMTRA
ncbi:MAG: PilW family protein [Gammaproteobacteria bacterium]